MEGIVLSIIGLAILLLLSAFFSSSETALTSFRRTRIRHLADEGNTNARILQSLIEQPSKFLATLLFGNTVVNVAIAVLAGTIALKYFPPQYAEIAATIIVSVIILIFGEIGPKSAAAERSEGYSLAIARPINWLTKALYPVIHIFINITNIFVKPIGGGKRKEGPFLTADEIKTILSVGEEQGVIEEEEREMIHSIFEFGETVVREIMVSRMDMVCLSIQSKIDDALDIMLKHGFSRVPLFEDNLDNIVGILYAKDILKQLKDPPERRSRAGKNGKATLKKLARPPHFVPETKKVDGLLKEMQKNKIHMAIVVDEYGGTAGLVTIEDIIEEIVGEIFDEYDTERIMFEELEPNKFRVDAVLPLGEFSEKIDVELGGEDWDTVGGFVYGQIGRIPKPGEKITYQNLTFIIEKIHKQRITKMRVEKVDKGQTLIS